MITLNVEPSIAHQLGAIVRKVNLGAAGGSIAIAQPAIPGDSCIFLAAVTGLATTQTVTITNGAAPAEYHTAFTFSAVADANGYYVLPPLSRVAQLQIHASQGAMKQDFVMQPDYSLPQNQLDFLIS